MLHSLALRLARQIRIESTTAEIQISLNSKYYIDHFRAFFKRISIIQVNEGKAGIYTARQIRKYPPSPANCTPQATPKILVCYRGV